MANPLSRVRALFHTTDENLFARSLTLNVIGRTAGMALGFISSIALARLLGPADRGLVGLMLAVSTIALALFAIGQPLAVTYYASRKDADARGILGNTILHTLILAVILIPFTYYFYQEIEDLFGHHQGGRTWVLAAALVPITFLDWTSSNQLLGMLRFGLFNALKLLAALLYTVAVLVLLGPLNMGVTGALIATAIGSFVTIAVSIKPILGGRRPRLNFSLMKRMYHYGARVQVGVIFQQVNYRLDVVIMQFYRPLDQVGYYVVAQTIAELVITLATAFQSSLLPLTSHYEGQERQNEVTKLSIRHHGILAFVAGVFNAAFGTAVILFAYGSAFRPAVAPMLVLLPGIWFLGQGLVIQSDLGGRARPGLSSTLAGMAAVVTALLDIALIPPFGVMGGAIASDIAYTTFGVASMFALVRVSGIPLRELVVPTREDFMVYVRVARRGLDRLAETRPARAVGLGRRRRRTGSFPERHPHLTIIVLGAVGAAVLYPLLGRPEVAALLIAAALAAWIASRSVVIPLALGSVPPLVDAIAGSDPLPSGGFTFLFAAWITLSIGFVFLRGRHELPLRALMCLPVLASVVILGLMLIRLGPSPDQAYGSSKLQLYVADVLIFLVGAVFVGVRRKDVNKFMLVTLLVAGTGAVLFLYNLVAGAAHPTVGGRYSLSANEYPIELGRDSSIGLLIAIYLMLTSGSRRVRLLATAAAPALAIAMIAAGSRGPVLAFVFGLLSLLALTAVDARARRRLAVVAAMFVAVAIIVPLVVPGSALGRSLSAIIGSASGLSSNGRSDLWALATTIFSKHLALGLGTGGFAGLGTGLNYPHNILLEAAAELGIVGAIAILCVIFGMLRRLAGIWRTTDGPDKLMSALLISLFLTALVNACFSGAIMDNRDLWVWGGIGIGMAAGLAEERRLALGPIQLRRRSVTSPLARRPLARVP